MEWSRQDLATLRAEAHLGAAHLSHRLGRSMNAVRQKAAYMRISLRPRGSRSGLILGQRRGAPLPKATKVPVIRGIVSLDPDEPLQLCPHCTAHYVTESEGICLVCRAKSKFDEYVADHAEVLEAARDFTRDYNKAKKRIQRYRESMVDDWEPDW